MSGATGLQRPRTGTGFLYWLLGLAQRYPDAIQLGRGDVDFPTPAHIVAAIREGVARGAPRPSPPEGLPELRAAIGLRVRTINGIQVDPNTDIVVTSGGQEALFLAVHAILGPGDEMIVPEPNYNTYFDAIEFAEARAVPVVTAVEEDFDIDPERVQAAITERTRALLLVSPNNPSAAVSSPARVEELGALAEAFDLIILADDTYDRFLYESARHTSPASLGRLRERTLTVNTLSKTYAMTGWRLGWVVGPAAIMGQIRALKETVSGGTSILAQYGGLAALTEDQECVTQMHAAYTERRRIVMDALDRLRIRYGKPSGGQFLFADIRPLGVSSLDLVPRLLEEVHVLVYPGGAFGETWDGFLRITFLQPAPILAEGMDRFSAGLQRLV